MRVCVFVRVHVHVRPVPLEERRVGWILWSGAVSGPVWVLGTGAICAFTR